MLMERGVFDGGEVGGKEEKFLAKAHFEIWRASTLTADPFNLARADFWYEKALKRLENVIDVNIWIEFSRVLEARGVTCERLLHHREAARRLHLVGLGW